MEMRKKIIIASDSFKGSLTSLQVGQAVAHAIAETKPEQKYEIIPVADGGEGTVEALVSGMGGKFVEAEVTGPLGEPVKAKYGLCGDTAVIEMAAASGLPLVPEKMRNPWLTTSYGTGELIREALIRGCRKFLIGIGGSATNDAGTGMLRALGFKFLDENEKEVGDGGGETGRIRTIDRRWVIPQLKDACFTIACDVTNPLTGTKGASKIFGPQKGADTKMMEKLDASLSSFAQITTSTIGEDFSMIPGAGAAGGLGFAFMAFLKAKLIPGIEMVLNAVDFDNKLKEASLVITGEGRLDKQTCMGKTPYGVLRHAKKMGVPVIAISGSIEPDAVDNLMKAGFNAVFPIVSGPIKLSEALKPEIASKNVERTVSQILRILNLTV